MSVRLSYVLLLCLACLLLGAYWALHPFNLEGDLKLAYEWAVRMLHGGFRCPDNYVCTRR